MATNRFPLVFLLTILLLNCCQASLLKETLAREFTGKSEDVDEIKVEVVGEEKNKEGDTRTDKDTDSRENKNKAQNTDTAPGETAKDNESRNEEEGTENESKIHLETIYRPVNCDNAVTKSGKVAVLHYTGYVGEKKFDSTLDPLKRYVPFEFIVGTGSVIKGFEQGIKQMCIGEQRKIIIPPELGYGSKGAGLIPGNATIRYDVQLLDVREPPPQADVFGAMDGDGDKKLSRHEVTGYMKKQAEMHYGAPLDDYYWSQYHNQMVDNIFAQDDEDDDGHISHDEFSGPKLYHEEL